ncbi:MAG: Calx-beta domain-containing protein [Thermoguttaceae bacterium]
MERLEDRTVLSGGLVLTAFGSATYCWAEDVFLDSANQIVVAGRAGLSASDFAVARYQASTGALDPSFGNGAGWVTTDVGRGFWDGGTAAVPYPADAGEKILVGGLARAKFASYDWALARYNGVGTLDTTFGGLGPSAPGTVQTDLGTSTTYQERVEDMLVDGEGRIVAVGTPSSLVRYTPEGRLDREFSSDGIVDVGFAPAAVALTRNQSQILVLGTREATTKDFAVARYNLDGTLDTSFGQEGIATCDFGEYDEAEAMAVDALGRIVVFGNACEGYYRFGLARLGADGSLDTTFGNAGRVQKKFESSVAAGPTPTDMVIDGQTGKIITVGYTNEYPQRFIVARFKPDGDLDPSFSDDGAAYRTIFDSASDSAMALAVTVEPNGAGLDGDVIVAGAAYHVTGGTKEGFAALARYQANGVPEEAFGAPSIIIGDVYQSEGNSGTTNFSFTVRLSGPSSNPITVNYATANGTARGSDYVAQSGTLEIPANATTGTIPVQVIGDRTKEQDETFYLNLSVPSEGYVLLDGQAVATIWNDDGGKTSSAALASCLEPTRAPSAAIY